MKIAGDSRINLVHLVGPFTVVGHESSSSIESECILQTQNTTFEHNKRPPTSFSFLEFSHNSPQISWSTPFFLAVYL